MLCFKLLMAAAALVCVSARHLVFEDGNNIFVLPVEDLETNPLEPMKIGRMRRDADKLNSAALSNIHIKGVPGHGADRLALNGRLNVLNTDNHKLDGTGFAAQFRPEASQRDNINTFGVGADYMYKSTLGAEVKAAYTPQFDKTDYSALGKVSLFHDAAKDRSLDLTAGYARSQSPYGTFSEPFAGVVYQTRW